MSQQAAQHQLLYLSVDILHPNSWNPQVQAEDVFQRLVQEISDVGFIDPCEVVPLDSGGYRIIGGQHRWEAAKKLGMDEIPCIVLGGKKWQDEDLQKFVTLRLNVIRGKTDPTLFAALYTEMAEKYGKEALQSLMGFTDERAFQKIVDGTRKAIKKSLPPELAAEFDRRAKDAKTAADLQNIVQTLFAKYGDTVDRSFMIFTYGKQEHVYVCMSKATRKAVDKLVSLSKLSGADLNDILAPILTAGVKDAAAKFEQSQTAPPELDFPS